MSTVEAVSTTTGPDEPVVAELKHPRALRWMHWFNFPLLLVMIWSGLRIYWAEDVYRIGFGDTTLFGFFPDAFYEVLDLDRSLAIGLAYHFFFGWLFFANAIAYGIWTAVTGEWRRLVPIRGSLRRSWQVVLHDIGLRDEEPPHRGIYNDAQRLTYTAVMVMGLLSILTGLAIYKPTQLAWLTASFGGYQPSRAIHFVLTLGFAGFFVVHVLQVARAGWGNFWSMVMGYERRTPTPVSATDEEVRR